MADRPEICALGEMPELGVVPEKMHAFMVRQDRFGAPKDAWKREIIPVPELGPLDVLVYVMASGINYNNVWAGLGYPIDVIAERQKKGEPEDFHAGGSDCSGIVWAVGSAVDNVKVGDEVVVASGYWDADDPWVVAGKDPMLASSVRVWGYQTNYGSYCQFARAQSHQIQPRPKHLTWEESACYLLCASTAYRMLMGFAPHTVEEGDAVLVWGATGGLGSLALQIVQAMGGKPIAVVSDESKKQFCIDKGAVGVINRQVHPGQVAVPVQLIDYTFGRKHSYYNGDGELDHIDFTHPFTESLRQGLLEAGRQSGVTVYDGGVYGVTQGPRLETAAEVDRYERDGADFLGMTAMPEASLAREIGMEYACLSLIVNHAAGRGERTIHEDLEASTMTAKMQAMKVLRVFFGETE